MGAGCCGGGCRGGHAGHVGHVGLTGVVAEAQNSQSDEQGQRRRNRSGRKDRHPATAHGQRVDVGAGGGCPERGSHPCFPDGIGWGVDRSGDGDTDIAKRSDPVDECRIGVGRKACLTVDDGRGQPVEGVQFGRGRWVVHGHLF